MRVALIAETFPDRDRRLRERLAACGASLACLPELPVDRWIPATDRVRDEDAEPPDDGPRAHFQSAAAADAGVAVLGGAIVATADGRRNRATLWDASGRALGAHDKQHVPDEDGFRERAHYGPGAEPPRAIVLGDLRVGIQICSDVQRPVGSQLLAAQGVDLVLVPRASPLGSYARWRTTLIATALATAAYVASCNRDDIDAPRAAPSIAIAPDGEVLIELDAGSATFEIDAERLAAARRDYPGYLERPVASYAAGWAALRDAGRDAGRG